MDLRLGGPNCTKFAADERPDIGDTVLDFLIFSLIFKSERSECERGRKTRQNRTLFDPCKIREG